MKVGAQLFTLRDYTKTRDAFLETLDRVAEMGYDGVQLSAVDALQEMSAEEVRVALDDRELTCAATHRPWEKLAMETEAEIASHQALGCTYTAVGVPPGGVHEAGLDGYRTWLAKAQATATSLLEGGIRFGYHNHAREFERMDGGVRPFDVLRDAEWFPLELDTYWVHAGGMNLLAVIKGLSGRLPVVHVKDIAPFDWAVTYAPVGEGNLDWSLILPAFRAAGTEWLLVEQDECRRDPFDCLASSLRFLRASL